MWISRKKYNELTKELNSLRVYAEIFDSCLRNSFELKKEEMESNVENLKKEIEEDAYDDISIMKAIVDSDTTTRTNICREIGISFKTLRNIVNGSPVKPSTREKLRNYIYNKQGGIKKEILDKIK